MKTNKHLLKERETAVLQPNPAMCCASEAGDAEVEEEVGTCAYRIALTVLSRNPERAASKVVALPIA